MNWNKLLIILWINIVFSQGNYQLLTVPHNFNAMFKTSQVWDNKNLSFFHLMYPNEINLSSITFLFPDGLQRKANKLEFSEYYFDFSYLNYGKLIDSENNHSFYPDEVLIKINRLKNYTKNLNLLYSAGYMISSLDIYSSSAIIGNFFISFEDLKKQIVFGVKNFGQIIDSYTAYKMKLPTIIHLTFLRKFKPIEIQVNYEKRLDIDYTTYTFSSKIHFNKNIKFYLCTNSNRDDLLYGDYIDKITVATSFGLSYNNKNNIISIGMQNLGAAGYSTGIYFEKVSL